MATFVLVHGAWHAASCWQRLISLMEDKGHRVIAPDLPGHGSDSTPLGKLSLNLYSSYIHQLIDNIDNNIILLGHSMGGMVISQLAEEMPEKITRLVYLAAFLPQNGQSIFDLMAINRSDEAETEIEKAMEMSSDKRVCTIKKEAIRVLFYGHCTDEMVEQALQQFTEQAILPLAGKAQLTEENFGRVKKIYICCLHDRVIPVSHQRRMISRQRCDEVMQIYTDHSPFYSCPEELEEILSALASQK